jgi:hypothetical protein
VNVTTAAMLASIAMRARQYAGASAEEKGFAEKSRLKE